MLEAVGGEAGCLKLSEEFYGRVAKDPELHALFPGKTLKCAIGELSAFLVQFLGGDDDKTQFRHWLSLRESHARFHITELQRLAWLKQMEATLQSSNLEAETTDSLHQFFVSSSAYLLGTEGEEVCEPELRDRWRLAQSLDELVANIHAGRDLETLEAMRTFASRSTLYVGILAKMLQTGRPTLVAAVGQEIELNPELAFRRYGGWTLVHTAAAAGCPEIVALLLRLGVAPDVLDNGSHSPLYRVANGCSAETGPEIVRMLVQAGADVNFNGGATRATPLHMAARRGHLGVAQALLDLGASRSMRDTKGCTPLDRAINCRKPEIAKLLQQRTT